MSHEHIRNALEAALAAVAPAIAIVHENESFDPVDGQPYCEAYVLFAAPGNPTMGDGFHQEVGILQINLQFPPGVGSLAAAKHAQLIKDAFPRGATFADGGIAVQIDRTADVGAGLVEAGRWFVPIKIRWHADIYS